MRMKITILQGAFLPVPALRGGAVEKIWIALGREFVARGHQVTHVSRWCDGLVEEEIVDGVRHVRVRGFDRPSNRLVHSLMDFVYSWRAARRAPDADVVVTNSFWSPVLLRRRQGAVYVDVQRMPRGQMKLYRKVPRLRANSSSVAQAILEDDPCAGARVKVIPNPLPFEVGHAVDWTRKEKVVLFVGRLHPEKGIELLLEAWRLFGKRREFSDWRLEIVGPIKENEGGGGEKWVDDLRRRFPLENVVWRAPVYDPAVLNGIYERATVFAYPSLAKGETFGLAVLEAMAWGAAPVVSNLSCFRDFVKDGENGIIFDHEASVPAHELSEGLTRAASEKTGGLARRAMRVHDTHSISAIANLFLADFDHLHEAQSPST